MPMVEGAEVGHVTHVNMMTVIIIKASFVLCHIFIIYFNMMLISHEQR